MDKLQRLSKRKFLALDFPASRARIFLEFLKKIAVSVRFLIFSAYYIVMKEKFYRAGYFAAGCIRSVLSYSFARESCISCSRPVVSVPLCRKCLDECMSAFESDFSKRCSVCGKELLGELKICMKCRTENLFSQVDQVLPMFPYRLWMKKLIFEWKMDGRRSVSTLFASVLDVGLKSVHADVIVPVPPRRGKIREKGWDQVDEVCKVLERCHGYTVLRLLQRFSRDQQKKLDREKRIEGSGKSYGLSKKHGAVLEKWRKKNGLGEKEVPTEAVIVDDVITTGATVSTCAGILKGLGIKTVKAVSIVIVD